MQHAYMQLLPICNFFLAPKVTFALKTRQLYATDGYMLLFCGSRAVAYIPILLYMQLFPGSRFSEVLNALIFLRVYATDGYMQLFCGSGGVAYIPILLQT